MIVVRPHPGIPFVDDVSLVNDDESLYPRSLVNDELIQGQLSQSAAGSDLTDSIVRCIRQLPDRPGASDDIDGHHVVPMQIVVDILIGDPKTLNGVENPVVGEQ